MKTLKGHNLKISNTIKTLMVNTCLPHGGLSDTERILKTYTSFPEEYNVFDQHLGILSNNEFEGFKSDHVMVNGNLKITNCTNFTLFPKKSMMIVGHLWVLNLPELKELPEEIYCYGSIEIKQCPNLEKLPKKIFCVGSLTIQDSPKIKELPRDLTVCGNITVYGAKINKISKRSMVLGNVCFDLNKEKDKIEQDKEYSDSMKKRYNVNVSISKSLISGAIDKNLERGDDEEIPPF